MSKKFNYKLKVEQVKKRLSKSNKLHLAEDLRIYLNLQSRSLLDIKPTV
jgi:hypothetical protein